jgi:hypothetical protein
MRGSIVRKCGSIDAYMMACVVQNGIVWLKSEHVWLNGKRVWLKSKRVWLKRKPVWLKSKHV